MVNIEIQPLQAMNDVPWHIKVSNLRPSSKYTIVSSCQPDVDFNTFKAYAHYISDDKGVIDVNTMASFGGTYTGIEPMGLMWSLAVEKEEQRADINSPEYNKRIFFKRNVQYPVEVTISVSEGHDKFENSRDLDAASFLAQQHVERQYMSPLCQRIPIREGRLRGTLFVPKGEGPFHAVLDIYGGGGGLYETRASLLASHRYVTLALAFYAFDDLPTELNTDLEYFLEAIDFLLSLPFVQKSGVGILSLCFGGSLAMHIATICPKVKALVNVCGSSYLTTGFTVTYKGVRLFSGGNSDAKKITDKGISYIDVSPVIEDHCIPIEKAVNCKFLFINGEDDKTVSWTHGKILHSRCPDRSQLFVYPEAGHIIDPPYNPHNEGRWLKGLKFALVYGGSIRGHSRAQEDAWKQILTFFGKNLSISSMI